MKFTIGTKLIGGFIIVSLLVAIAGGLGLSAMKRISTAADQVINEEVPIVKETLNLKAYSVVARDAMAEYLLKDTDKIEELTDINSEFRNTIQAIEMRTQAIISGNEDLHIKAASSDSKIIPSCREILSINNKLKDNANELMKTHREALELKTQPGAKMEEMDAMADELLDTAREENFSVETITSLWAQVMAVNDFLITGEDEEIKAFKESFDIVRSDPKYYTIKSMHSKVTQLGEETINLFKEYKKKADTTFALMEIVDETSEQLMDLSDHVSQEAIRGMNESVLSAQGVRKASQNLLISITTIALISAILIGFLLARGITRPISLCVEFAKQVARGDLSRQVEINTQDETRDLGDALNGMFGYLKGMAEVADGIAGGDLTMHVKPASEHDVFGNSFTRMVGSLRDMVGKVRTSSESVASAADEISAATDQITKGAQNQASASEETGSTMEEMSVQIQNVAKNAEGLARNVDETTSSIQQMGSTAEGVAKMAESMASNVAETSSTIEQMIVTLEKTAANVSEADKLSKQASDEAVNGGDAVMKMVEGMKIIGEMMGNITGVIQSLGQRSEAIGSIVKVIEEIADQTNLLALNAAIEAARAGEAGQGFAVVADEVRKLAERSVKATKEIGDVIKQVQAETTSAVKATEEGAKSSREGLGLADQAASAIARIMDSVKSTSNIMQEISRATTEQSTAARNVVAAVEEMNRLTQSVTQSTSEQAAGIQQVVKAAEAMSQLTEQVKNATTEQKRGGDNVLKAVENISEIAKGNLSAVEQLSRSAKDMARQSEGLQELVQTFRLS
ncbi:MAG: methyl-accepting chemotaxis protein [bacterium]